MTSVPSARRGGRAKARAQASLPREEGPPLKLIPPPDGAPPAPRGRRAGGGGGPPPGGGRGGGGGAGGGPGGVRRGATRRYGRAVELAAAVLEDERDALPRQPELGQQRCDPRGEAEPVLPGAGVRQADSPERERSDRGDRSRVPRLVDGAEREEEGASGRREGARLGGASRGGRGDSDRRGARAAGARDRGSRGAEVV